MKPRSQFATLSEQDQNHILELCSHNPYEKVVPRLKKPRSEGGLDIVTSRSALCRFFSKSHLDIPRAVLAQHAAAANIQHEQNSNAFLGAIRASVEARVLENLNAGKALADLDKDFKILKTAEALYLTDARWRAVHPKAARAAYQDHVERCAQISDIDFVPLENAANSNPTQPAHKNNPANIEDLSDFEQDVIKARIDQERRAEQRDQLLATLEAASNRGRNSPCGEPFHGIPRFPNHHDLPSARESAGTSHPESPKTPEIPHFSLNLTKPNIVAAKLAEPACNEAPTPNHQTQSPKTEPTNPPTKPVPQIRPTPKIGRNDPCPCGSRKKHKKCCLRGAGSGG